MFDHNLGLLTRPWSISTLVTWALLAALFAYRFYEKPWLLRVASGMIVPLLLASLFLGYLGELRGYYEVYVPVLALIAYSVCVLMGYQQIETIAPINASSVKRIRATTDANR